jgi:hypothetical protein
MTDDRLIFHLAIPIDNIAIAKEFYVSGLGCELGRESASALILNFYGHQLVAHISQEKLKPQNGIYPRHFGLVFPTLAQWEDLVNRAKNVRLKFYQEPRQRFLDKITEHYTCFLEDPFYNLLEFKYYRHAEAIFGGRELAEVGDLSDSI